MEKFLISRTLLIALYVSKQTIYLEKVKSDLAALDQTILLHEIQIDPNKIAPVITYQIRIKLKYGQLTQLIYERLGEAAKDGSLPKEWRLNLKTLWLTRW